MELSKEQEEWLWKFRAQYLNAVKGPVREEFCLKEHPVFLEASFALQYLPDELKTEELCLAAVQQNDKTLEFVPEALREKVQALLVSHGTERKELGSST